MTAYNYNKIGENSAKASGLALPISSKHSIEICNLIRNKKLSTAKTFLEKTINLKKPIPFRRFTGDVGHKKGNLTSGRYPVKASQAILDILNSAEKNALTKGLSVDDLVIVSIIPNRGAGDLRHGRLRGRQSKRTHIHVIVEEQKKEKKKQDKKKEKTEPQKEIKKEVKKETKKEIPNQAEVKQENKPETPTEVIKND